MSIVPLLGDRTAGTIVDGTFLSSSVTATRASNATAFDSSGNLVTYGNNVLRPDFDPITRLFRGWLIEGGRTNSLRNSGNSGAVVGTIGSGGSLPTRVTVPVPRGLTIEVTSTGTSSGMGYADIRFSGTAATTGMVAIFFEATTQIAAVSGQTWSAAAYAALQAGSAPSGGFTMSVNGRDVGGAAVEASSTAAALTSTIGRFSSSYTLVNASSVFVIGALNFSVTTGLSYDFTLRVWERQLEQGAFATSQILTTTVAATRAADSAVINTLSNIGYNSAQGTIFMEFERVGNGLNSGLLAFNDNTANEIIGLRSDAATATTIVYDVVDGGVAQAALSLTGGGAGAVRKIAFAYAANDFAASIGGAAVVTDASGTLPAVDRLTLGNTTFSGATQGSLWIRNLNYTGIRQPNATLVARSA